MSLAGDLDLVVGESDSSLTRLEGTGTTTRPAFLQREGDDNPFDGVSVSFDSRPALGDLDSDGMLRRCP